MFILEIKRSNRKTIAIKITRQAKVVVFAPIFCSEKNIMDFVNSKKEWIEFHKAKRQKWIADNPEPSEAEIVFLKNKAREELPKVIEKYSCLTSLYPTGVKITSAKGRFGSCSSKNSICFSYHLMKFPREAIEYVVLHELVHIKHKNHSKEFYKEIEKFMPDYKQRQELLR